MNIYILYCINIGESTEVSYQHTMTTIANKQITIGTNQNIEAILNIRF